MAKLDDVKQQAGELTADEMRDLRAWLAMQLGTSGESIASTATPSPKPTKRPHLEDGADMLANDLIHSIAERMRSIQGEAMSPHRLKQGPQWLQFRQIVREELYPYFNELVERNRVKRTAFIELVVRLLSDTLTGWGVPVTSRTMMTNAYRIPSVVNKAFPGYAASGLLHLVIRSENDDVRNEQD
jgi:hypothetical protein